jgi:hypothetical protein
MLKMNYPAASGRGINKENIFNIAGGSITATGTSESIHLDKALFHLHPEFREKAKAAAPGWNVYCLEQEWRDWIAKKERPENLGAAFIAFCRKKYQPGRKTLKGMALQERRSPENKRKV